MAERIITDVVIAGTGVQGLSIGNELTERGLSVVMLEKQHQLATGSSTRNVRGLRIGGHDLAGKDVSPAHFREARRAQAGYKSVVEIAPFAINSDISSFAVFNGEVDQKTIHERWEKEGMWHEFVSPRTFRAANPGVRTGDIAFAAKIEDTCIDSRLLYQELQHRIVQKGGKIFTDAEILYGTPESNIAEGRIGTNDVQFEAQAYIIAAGYGANDVYHNVVDSTTDLPLRYGRAYVLGMPKVTESTLVPLGPDIPSISTTNDVSLFLYGSPTLVDEPNFDVPGDRKEEIMEAVQNLVPGANVSELSTVHACITLDTSRIPGISPDGKILQHDYYTFVWPGMMTVATEVARSVAAGLSLPEGDKMIVPAHLQQDALPIAPYPTEHALKDITL